MKLTQSNVEKLPFKDKRYVEYDNEIKGFAVRVGALAGEEGKARKVFYFVYRSDSGNGPRRWLTLGAFGAVTAKEAREKAEMARAKVAMGEDPATEKQEARKALKVAEALTEFLDQYVSKLAPKTLEQYEILIRLYAIPGLGTKKLEAVTKQDLQALHRAIGTRKERPSPSMANRLIKMLSKFFGWCAEAGYTSDQFNPAHKLKLYPEKGKTGYFQPPELAAIQNAIVALENDKTLDWRAAGIIRLLIMTAARRDEIQTLRWEYLDLENGRANLPQSKTGEKVLHLPGPAIAVLRQIRARLDQEPLLKDSPWVFPSDKLGGKKGHMVEIRRPWKAVLTKAGISDGVDGAWTLHHLRHSWASNAVNQRVSIALVSKVLGHSQIRTTQRYAHVLDQAAAAVAEEVTASIVGWPAPEDEPAAPAAAVH